MFYQLEVWESHSELVHRFHSWTPLPLPTFRSRFCNMALSFHSIYLTLVRGLLWFFCFELIGSGFVDRIGVNTSEITPMDMANVKD